MKTIYLPTYYRVHFMWSVYEHEKKILCIPIIVIDFMGGCIFKENLGWDLNILMKWKSWLHDI